MLEKFLDRFTIKDRRELRKEYTRTKFLDGNLIDLIGSGGYVNFNQFRQFFRISPSSSVLDFERYVNSLNYPNMRTQDQLLLNFVLNFSRLDNGETQVGNLHVHLDDINFHSGTDTMELIFSFTKLHDAKLKQFDNATIWKKLLDMAFPSTYAGTKYALRRNSLIRLSQFTDKTGTKFESKIINYKIVVIDQYKEEFVLNYKTKLDLEIRMFYAESVVIQDLIIVKDFTQLPYVDFKRLLKSYEEFHTHSSIEKFDAIDAEVDKIFDKFGTFHFETISPYIEETDEGEESA